MLSKSIIILAVLLISYDSFEFILSLIRALNIVSFVELNLFIDIIIS